MKRGASPKAIAAQLLKAINGEYHAKSYTERDAKIADICLILGGPRLLGVMQAEFNCCSKDTFPTRLALLNKIQLRRMRLINKFLSPKCAHGLGDVDTYFF